MGRQDRPATDSPTQLLTRGRLLRVTIKVLKGERVRMRDGFLELLRRSCWNDGVVLHGEKEGWA